MSKYFNKCWNIGFDIFHTNPLGHNNINYFDVHVIIAEYKDERFYFMWKWKLRPRQIIF